MTNKNLEEYLLDNAETMKDVVRELNGWNGSLENLSVEENDEDFFNVHFEGNPMEAVRAAHYGEYNFMDDLVRFNGYGNLESLSETQYEEELKSSIGEIMDNLISEYNNINIYDSELDEILEEITENN